MSTHAYTGDSWTLTGKSGLVSCGVTTPFFWVLMHTGFVSNLQESVSPVLWKFCNQIPLAFKVKFSRGSQSLCQITRLGNLFWVLELSQQCKNFFGITVCQFVGCLLSGSVVGLTRRASRSVVVRAPSLSQATADLYLSRRHSNTQRQVWLSLL